MSSVFVEEEGRWRQCWNYVDGDTFIGVSLLVKLYLLSFKSQSAMHEHTKVRYFLIGVKEWHSWTVGVCCYSLAMDILLAAQWVAGGKKWDIKRPFWGYFHGFIATRGRMCLCERWEPLIFPHHTHTITSTSTHFSPASTSHFFLPQRQTYSSRPHPTNDSQTDLEQYFIIKQRFSSADD